jgi:hypothetical protein
MTQLSTSITLVITLSLLGFGCGQVSDDDDNTFSVGVDDDDDSTPPPPEEGAVLAYVEFTRHATFEVKEASVTVLSSWFSPAVVELRPPTPSDSDSCESRTIEEGSYALPSSDLDVGSPSLVIPSGASLNMEFESPFWVNEFDPEYWESHQEYEIVVTGGSDLSPSSFPGALVTPAGLTINLLEETEEGLQIEWVGGNNNGDIELRLVQESATAGSSSEWVVCRLTDDGAATLSSEDFSSFSQGEDVSLELLRSTSANFKTEAGVPGIASGIATASWSGWFDVFGTEN